MSYFDELATTIAARLDGKSLTKMSDTTKYTLTIYAYNILVLMHSPDANTPQYETVVNGIVNAATMYDTYGFRMEW